MILKLKLFLINVLLPLLMGTLLYISFRTTSIRMFTWFEILGIKKMIFLIRSLVNPFKNNLPDWVCYSLPDALWVYSFTSIYLILWNNKINYWLIFPFFFGCVVEIAQKLKIFEGTYDPIDLILCLIAFILSIYINQLTKNNEKNI
jgi:hypothetical protein